MKRILNGTMFILVGIGISWITFFTLSSSKIDYVQVVGVDYLDYAQLDSLCRISSEYYNDYDNSKVISIQKYDNGYKVFLSLEGANESPSAYVLIGNSNTDEGFVVLEHGRIFY